MGYSRAANHPEHLLSETACRPLAELTGLNSGTVYLWSRAEQIAPFTRAVDYAEGVLFIAPKGRSLQGIRYFRETIRDLIRLESHQLGSRAELARHTRVSETLLDRFLSPTKPDEWFSPDIIERMERHFNCRGQLWASLHWEELRHNGVTISVARPPIG